jgi:hypothetical protein
MRFPLLIILLFGVMPSIQPAHAACCAGPLQRKPHTINCQQPAPAPLCVCSLPAKTFGNDAEHLLIVSNKLLFLSDINNLNQ